MIYKLKQISLEPDKYGNHLVIKMITQYDDSGNYIKHIKLDEAAKILARNGVLVPEESLIKRENIDYEVSAEHQMLKEKEAKDA